MEIRVKYRKEMIELNNELLKMAIIVRKTLDKSVKALLDRDINLAKEVVVGDRDIDQMELDLCDQCAILIATEQPVAHDLRIIVGALKIVTDLERMADLACHIAKATIKLEGEEIIPLIDFIPKMTDIAGQMTEDSIIAFIHQDGDMAENIALLDDKIDEIYKKLTNKLLQYMVENPDYIEQGSTLMFLSRSIERYADHAENICEWVVYTSTGVHKEL